MYQVCKQSRPNNFVLSAPPQPLSASVVDSLDKDSGSSSATSAPMLLSLPASSNPCFRFSAPFAQHSSLIRSSRDHPFSNARRLKTTHFLPAAESWGPWFLFALFAGILVWEDVWHLNTHAALSGGLLILITSGAVICSAIFERRIWCRHLCPIGGMNGLFAKLSMTEVRARQGVCSGKE